MIGIALLLCFLAFAAAMYVRVLPAILAVPAMAVALAAISGAPPLEIGGAIVAGSTKLSFVFVTVIFGALLSRVTLSTGIAETIVTYAAEFGGDRPMLLALALAAAVALLFTSLTGLGAIIMVGSIVLPIMMTIGVPRKLAATLFMLAFALGFIFNIAQWTFYTQTFGVAQPAMRNYALVLGAVDLLALLVFAFVRFRLSRGYATWAVVLDDEEESAPKRRVPPYALVTPLVPIVLYYALKLDPLLAFAIAALYGVLTTRPREAIATLIASAVRGVEDVAPAILLFIGIGMLLAVTALPETRAALGPLVAAIAPRNPVAYVVLFGILSPLALFRGPLNPFGVGIAVYTVLAGLGVLPPVVLVAAVMAVVQVQNACDPTNTQNVWVANFTGVRVDEIALLMLPYQVAVATAATIAVVLFGPQLFGVAPFAPAASPASAAVLPLDPNVTPEPSSAPATAPPPAPPAPGPAPTSPVFGAGLYAPPQAARTIAVVAAAPGFAQDGADEIARSIARGWPGFSTVRATAQSLAGSCANKPYAAQLLIHFETSILGPPPLASAHPEPPLVLVEAGLELRDCSGYPVDQWYDDETVEYGALAANRARTIALGLLDRLRLWTVDHPHLANALFTRGLALESSAPTYLYSLFKTTDGQMRAYVRDGGPAYDAGLRTNDIVEKLDGKYWWEYGTYQTQARAYDGKPHVFEIERNGREYRITLGAPISGAPS